MTDSTTSTSSSSLPRATDLHSSSSEFSAYGSLGSALPHVADHTITSTTLKTSHLDKIQNLLLRGDRRGACHYAADERLWSHALVIASSIDKECFREVVTEFVRAELAKSSQNSGADGLSGRESLRVAYSLYGGNGASSSESLPLESQRETPHDIAPQSRSLYHQVLCCSVRICYKSRRCPRR